jgi:hypothetical protein
MATASREQIKNWFKSGMKPLESQFANWIDSFFHKNDSIPTSNINGLSDILDEKYDRQTGENLAEAVGEHEELLQGARGNLQVQIDAANGSGGFIPPNDFGTSSPAQQQLTDYAMGYIFGEDAANHNASEIFNGTKVQNLNDNKVWQLANTPDTSPAIFSWEIALNVSIAQRDFTTSPIQTNEIGNGSVTSAKLAMTLFSFSGATGILIADDEDAAETLSANNPAKIVFYPES